MFAEFGKVFDSVKAVQLGKHELEVGVTHVDVVSRCIPLASNVFEDVQQLIEVVRIIKELRSLKEILVVHHCKQHILPVQSVAVELSHQHAPLLGSVDRPVPLEVFNVVHNNVNVSLVGPVIDKDVRVSLRLHQVTPLLFVVDVVQVALVGPDGGILIPRVVSFLDVLHHCLDGSVQVQNNVRAQQEVKALSVARLDRLLRCSVNPSLV